MSTTGRIMAEGTTRTDGIQLSTPNYDGDTMLSRLDFWLMSTHQKDKLLMVAWAEYVGSDGSGLRGQAKFKAAGLERSQFYAKLKEVRRVVRHWRDDYHAIYQGLDSIGP